MTTESVKLTIPNTMAYLPLVLSAAREMAGVMGFAADDIYKLEMGLEEAVTNVIQYAFDACEQAEFDIILERQPIGLNIVIKEKGAPFDPAQIHSYSRETLAEDLAQKGLGTFLMQQCFDDVLMRNLGRGGMETHLYKHLNNKPVQEVISARELSEAQQDRDEQALPQGSVDYRVQRMSPDQAVEVSKVAYSSYGYTYVHEDIYYPDRVRELNNADQLISFVALTEQQEIIAHSALEIEAGGSPQLGVAFTKPRYRGQGCMNRLIAALIDEARARYYRGIYARAVSTHPYSQKTFLKYGFQESALYVSSGMEREYKGIEQQKMQRESVFIMYLYLSAPQAYVLFPPPQHRRMLAEIYQHLGVCPELIAAGSPAEITEEKTVLTTASDVNSLTAHIIVSSYGLDAEEQVHAKLKALCLHRLETIYLHLPLQDVHTAGLTAQFEALGFFFSGVMPGAQGNDELILQYLNNYLIDYDLLRPASDFGARLLAYIRTLDPNQLLTA